MELSSLLIIPEAQRLVLTVIAWSLSFSRSASSMMGCRTDRAHDSKWFGREIWKRLITSTSLTKVQSFSGTTAQFLIQSIKHYAGPREKIIFNPFSQLNVFFGTLQCVCVFMFVCVCLIKHKCLQSFSILSDSTLSVDHWFLIKM